MDAITIVYNLLYTIPSHWHHGKIIKITFFSFLLCILITYGLISTQTKLFWPIVDWIREIRGTRYLEGEERGTETLSIVTQLIVPVIFLISLSIVLLIMSKYSVKKGLTKN